MQFKNDSHKGRFMKTIKGMNQKDNTQMAVAFLLVARRKGRRKPWRTFSNKLRWVLKEPYIYKKIQ